MQSMDFAYEICEFHWKPWIFIKSTDFANGIHILYVYPSIN